MKGYEITFPQFRQCFYNFDHHSFQFLLYCFLDRTGGFLYDYCSQILWYCFPDRTCTCVDLRRRFRGYHHHQQWFFDRIDAGSEWLSGCSDLSCYWMYRSMQMQVRYLPSSPQHRSMLLFSDCSLYFTSIGVCIKIKF